jgi:hypothetical protein
MRDTPFPVPPSRNRDSSEQPADPPPAPALAPPTVPSSAQPARPVSPPNVWLCADPPGCAPEFSAGLSAAPLWARRVIAALSEPCERVIIRALRGYPGLPADVAALLRAAAESGRRPVALLPTPWLAARTRTWLRTPDPGTPDPGTYGPRALEAVATAPCPGPAATGQHPAITPTDVAAEHRAAGGCRAATHPRVAASRCPVIGPATVTAAASSPATDTGPAAATGLLPVTGTAAVTETSAGHYLPPVIAGVGVGRRRSGVEHGPAAAVIVLAGPVGAAARPARRAMPSARVLGQWARALQPGGVIGVLAPPPTGRHRRVGGWQHGPVPGLAEAGLVWSDRIVLIHASTQTPGEHRHTRSPQLPFAPVHTYLDLFESNLTDPPDPDNPDNPVEADGNPGVGR